MDLVYEVGWMTDTEEGAAIVDVLLPSIDFFIVLQREIDAFVARLNDETVRLEIDTLDIGDVTKPDKTLLN